MLCGFLPCSSRAGSDGELMLSDGTGANILPCWAGGRREQAMVSLWDFFFFSVQWIRTISLWVALSMVPIAPKPSGPMKTRPDSWKKKSCWDSDWFCLGWAHPCDHQPPQHCQKTLKKNIFLKIARDSPHVWEWWLLRGSETQFKVRIPAAEEPSPPYISLPVRYNTLCTQKRCPSRGAPSAFGVPPEWVWGGAVCVEPVAAI